MKTVKITYHCDYCKKLIDQDSDTVMAIMPGRIGYGDQFMPDQDEKRVQHYHDYCLEHILALDYSTEFPEDKSLEAMDKQEEPGPEHAPTKKEDNRKDLGKLQSLLNAGWTKTKIADEFGVHISTIYNWMKELEGGQR